MVCETSAAGLGELGVVIVCDQDEVEVIIMAIAIINRKVLAFFINLGFRF